jgi:hypothetical protein
LFCALGLRINAICQQSNITTPPFVTNNTLRGFSPQANYTERTTAACRRS